MSTNKEIIHAFRTDFLINLELLSRMNKKCFLDDGPQHVAVIGYVKMPENSLNVVAVSAT